MNIIVGKCKNCGASIQTSLVWNTGMPEINYSGPAYADLVPADNQVKCSQCNCLHEWMAMMTKSGRAYQLAAIGIEE